MPLRLVSYIDQKIVTLYFATLGTGFKRNHSAQTLHKFDAFSPKLTGEYNLQGTSACRPARRNIQISSHATKPQTALWDGYVSLIQKQNNKLTHFNTR